MSQTAESRILELWERTPQTSHHYHDVGHYMAGVLTERLNQSFPAQVLHRVIGAEYINSATRFMCMRPAWEIMADIGDKLSSAMDAINVGLGRQLRWMMVSYNRCTIKSNRDALHADVMSAVEHKLGYGVIHLHSATELSGWPASWKLHTMSRDPDSSVLCDDELVVSSSLHRPGRYWFSAVKIGTPIPEALEPCMNDVREFERDGKTYVEFPLYVEWKMILDNDKFIYAHVNEPVQATQGQADSLS